MTEREHLFISDVHLGAFSPTKEEEVERRLIALIDYAMEQQAQLYILGDLFDYWMEYPQLSFVPSIGKRVLDKFEEYNKSISPAVYITGNHDNWNFGYFQKKGFDVETNYRIVTIEESEVLLMHGDGQFGKRSDFIRPTYHRFLRNASFTRLYQRLFPPSLGLNLMKKFSNLTRKRGYRNPIPLSKHAEDILVSKDIDLVICGHDHIPRVETFSDGRYINLGTFFNHGTMARYKNGAFDLVIWHKETKEFVPFLSNSVEA